MDTYPAVADIRSCKGYAVVNTETKIAGPGGAAAGIDLGGSSK